jgi:SPP1 family predicted phage head-tail adaptor
LYFKDVIELISSTAGKNLNGFPTASSETFKQVFANKKSATRSEFYQAAAAGMKVDIVFEIRLVDYSGEKEIRYNSKRHKVIRTYETGGDNIELSCMVTE